MPRARARSSPVVFSRHCPQWAKAAQPLLKAGLPAEPEALAKLDLTFGIDRHLPEKRKHPEESPP